MQKETFIDLENILGLSVKSIFQKVVKNKKGKNLEFHYKVFSLNLKKFLELARIDFYNIIVCPFDMPEQVSDPNFDIGAAGWFISQPEVEVVVTFLDAGWETLLFGEFIGNEAMTPGVRVHSEGDDFTFSSFSVLKEYEIGGFLGACCGWNEPPKISL